MGEWHRAHPEEAEAISRLPRSEQLGAERAAMVDPLEQADLERKRRREEGEPPTVFWPGHRSVNGLPFERAVVDPAALVMAADLYAELCGDVDEVALGAAIRLYEEASES